MLPCGPAELVEELCASGATSVPREMTRPPACRKGEKFLHANPSSIFSACQLCRSYYNQLWIYVLMVKKWNCLARPLKVPKVCGQMPEGSSNFDITMSCEKRPPTKLAHTIICVYIQLRMWKLLAILHLLLHNSSIIKTIKLTKFHPIKKKFLLFSWLVHVLLFHHDVRTTQQHQRGNVGLVNWFIREMKFELHGNGTRF